MARGPRPRGGGGDRPRRARGLRGDLLEGGSTELDARARTEGGVRALQFALREGIRAKSKPAFVLFDQLHRMDAASVRVLTALIARSVALPAFLVMTCGPRFTCRGRAAT